MSSILAALNNLLLAFLLLVLWYLFFIMEIPYASIGDAAGQDWYQLADNGLLLGAGSATLYALSVLWAANWRRRHGRELEQRPRQLLTLLQGATTAGALFGGWVLLSFVFVSC